MKFYIHGFGFWQMRVYVEEWGPNGWNLLCDIHALLNKYSACSAEAMRYMCHRLYRVIYLVVSNQI